MSLIRIAGTHTKITRRHTALWIAVTPLTAFALLLALTSPAAPRTGGAADIAFAAQMLAMFCGVAYAAAFSDFLAAPARVGVHEVEKSTPTRPLTLRAARALGTVTVVTTPSALVLLVWGAGQSVQGHLFSVLLALDSLIVGGVDPADLSLDGADEALLGTVRPRGLARIVASNDQNLWMALGDTVTAGLFDGSPIYAPDVPVAYQADPWVQLCRSCGSLHSFSPCSQLDHASPRTSASAERNLMCITIDHVTKNFRKKPGALSDLTIVCERKLQLGPS